MTTKPVRVVFELSFPHAASWNGKWSGEGSGHYIFKEYPPSSFEHKWKDKAIGEWRYRWDDGWEALISSRMIDGKESCRLKRENKGFCGYSWMVDSILTVGQIMTQSALQEHLIKTEMEVGA